MIVPFAKGIKGIIYGLGQRNWRIDEVEGGFTAIANLKDLRQKGSMKIWGFSTEFLLICYSFFLLKFSIINLII